MLLILKRLGDYTTSRFNRLIRESQILRFVITGVFRKLVQQIDGLSKINEEPRLYLSYGDERTGVYILDPENKA